MCDNIQMILDAICDYRKRFGYLSFGIRTDDRLLASGDYPGNSHDLSNYAEGDDVLEGTCASDIGFLWFDGEEDDLETLKDAINFNAAYDGKHQYLIGGYTSRYGDDPREIIIPSAEVILALK